MNVNIKTAQNLHRNNNKSVCFPLGAQPRRALTTQRCPTFSLLSLLSLYFCCCYLPFLSCDEATTTTQFRSHSGAHCGVARPIHLPFVSAAVNCDDPVRFAEQVLFICCYSITIFFCCFPVSFALLWSVNLAGSYWTRISPSLSLSLSLSLSRCSALALSKSQFN